MMPVMGQHIGNQRKYLFVFFDIAMFMAMSAVRMSMLVRMPVIGTVMGVTMLIAIPIIVCLLKSFVILTSSS